jgi:hypothetical protein
MAMGYPNPQYRMLHRDADRNINAEEISDGKF